MLCPPFAYKDPPFLQIQIRAITTVRLSEETAHAFLTLHYMIIQLSKDLDWKPPTSASGITQCEQIIP